MNKIEVCGKLAIQGNVYGVTVNHVNGGKTHAFLRLSSKGFEQYGTRMPLCKIEDVVTIHSVNGEVLEDVPWEPKEGDWCVFSDYKDFRKYVISRFDSKDLNCITEYINETLQPWIHCKPFDPATFDLDRK